MSRDTASDSRVDPENTAPSTVTIDPSTDWGTWDGWGVSLAWWANVFGERDDLADLLFTGKTVSLCGDQLPGLRLNIARYNLGASTWTPAEGKTMVASPHIPRFKQIEGYWLDGVSDDPNSASWNWAADPRQRSMLAKARDRGADKLELFSNSPMWWMCRNHNPSGGPFGLPNLPRENFQRHARYLAGVARYARDHWGIAFTSVEPFNEPSSLNVWRSDGTQEGCVILPFSQDVIIEYLRHELDVRGLSAVEIAASDESYLDFGHLTWSTFRQSVKDQVGRVNVHGYEYEHGLRESLYRAVRSDGKPLWVSEYGGDDADGLAMARNFLLDMRELHPTGWVYWQVVDETPGWGFLLGDLEGGTLTSANTKHWVFAQLSRHIRPGMRIIGCDADHTVAAYDETRRRLVLVTVTPDTGAQVTYDLSKFRAAEGGPAGAVRRWITTTGDGGERYAAHPDDTRLTDLGSFTAWCPARSVLTFEVDNALA